MKVGLKYTSVPEHLFKTIDNSCPLDDTRREEFHTITAKTLWVNQQTLQDIKLSVGFCFTKNQESIEHDWKKLTHLMTYLWATRFIPLIIMSDRKEAIIYIDVTHIVNSNCKGYSGLFITQGKRVMINVSKKLGLVTNSSIETKIVAT